MTKEIICTVDHSPDGAKAGAFVGYILERDGDGDKRLTQLRDDYPGCSFAVREATA